MNDLPLIPPPLGYSLLSEEARRCPPRELPIRCQAALAELIAGLEDDRRSAAQCTDMLTTILNVLAQLPEAEVAAELDRRRRAKGA